MPPSTIKTQRFLGVVAAYLVGVLMLAGSLSAWLTEPSLFAQIWPSDINAWFVHLLGGSVTKNIVGQTAFSLDFFTVALRILGVTGVVVLVAAMARILVSARSVIGLEVSLWQTALVAVIGSSWWILWLLGEFVSDSVRQFAIACLPLWLPLLFASLIVVWLNAIFDFYGKRGSQGIQGDWAFRGLLLCVVGWVAVSWWMNVCLYEQLFIPHGDSAMYEEHLWNVWHGKGFRSYLDQGLFLGEHLQVIHLLLLPLHVIWPSQLMLELVESIALGSCAIPIYLIARRHTGDNWASCFLGVAWLFYFPMHFLDIAIDQKTFRPTALSLPFLFWLIEYSERRSFRKASICFLISLSAQEDIALITFPLMAIFAFLAWTSRIPQDPERPADVASIRYDVRWFSSLSLFSLAYLLLAVLVVIPAFRAGNVVHYSQYFGDLGSSPGELVKTALTDPLRVAAQFFSVRTFLYVLIFLAPLALRPAMSPVHLLAGLLTFGMLSLLQLGGNGTHDLPPVPYHHFHAPLLPVVFWAAISGVGRCFRTTGLNSSTEPTGWVSRTWRLSGMNCRGVAVIVMVCAMCTATTSSLMPCGLTFWSQESVFGLHSLYLPSDPGQQERARMVDVVVQQIPLSARVASTDYIHTRLTHCERSYDYSNYLRAVNNYQPGVPPDTDYIVIDTRHRYSEIRNADQVPELTDGKHQWELLPDKTNGAFLILKRR